MRSTTPWPLLAYCATTWRWGLSGARSRWPGPARSLRLAGSPAGTGTRQRRGTASSVSRRAPRPALSEPVPSPSPRGRPARDQGHRAGCRHSVPDRGLTSPTRTAFSSRRLGYGLSRLEEKYVLGGKRSPRFSRPRPGRLLHIARDVPPRGCPHGRSPTARGAPRLIDWHPPSRSRSRRRRPQGTARRSRLPARQLRPPRRPRPGRRGIHRRPRPPRRRRSPGR